MMNKDKYFFGTKILEKQQYTTVKDSIFKETDTETLWAHVLWSGIING